MTIYDWIQIIVFVAALIVATPILGGYMARVMEGNCPRLLLPLRWLERLVYRGAGVTPDAEMDWKEYTVALLIFNAIGLVVVFVLQILQSHLPLNPQILPNVAWPSAFNTAASFMTNTNWQGYAGETTLSYLVQMVGLTVQNFVSAATGIAVFVALTRGITRRSMGTLGNFWADMTRSVVYILLPLSIVLAVVLIGQGVVQNFSHYITAHTLEGAEQILPMGPAASQIAIKQLGTNGGGFFNANSTHPFENPTPFSNWLEMFSILLIPAALTFTYGVMVKKRKEGWVLFSVMMIIFLAGLGLSLYAEYSVNPVFGMGGIMEGKELRIGVTNSVLWSTATTAASNGSVNAMIDSMSPLAGGVALFNLMLGEIIFGGVGAGMYGMLMFVFLTVFLAGLMVGRTPEYLGKKIETREVSWVLVTILLPSAAILVGSSIAVITPGGLSSLANAGPHGLTEIIYAFTSAAQNNGSSFAGLNANTVFYNVPLGLCMLIGRFAVIVPVLAIAGSLVRKKYSPPSEGTFVTDSIIFMVLLIVVILIVGALTHLPSLALGPVVEHFLMLRGNIF